MVDLTIKLDPDVPSAACGLCGRPAVSAAGPTLVLAGGSAAVCQACGQKHTPALAALVRLAQVAERVGRMGRHTLVPPLAALLDLARVAEDYSQAVPGRRRVKAA